MKMFCYCHTKMAIQFSVL